MDVLGGGGSSEGASVSCIGHIAGTGGPTNLLTLAALCAHVEATGVDGRLLTDDMLGLDTEPAMDSGTLMHPP